MRMHAPSDRLGNKRVRAWADGAKRSDIMALLYRRANRAAAVQKIEKEIPIVNRLGLHARPAAMFVRIASHYRSEIWVSKEGEEVNGKSIMGLMMMAAGQGTKRC